MKIDRKKTLITAGGIAAAVLFAPLAHADGTQASLTDAVRQVYTQVQAKCTPNMPPNFQGIQLTGNGSGRIIDANPRLGGEFDYLWGPPGSPGTPGATYYRVPAQPNGDWYLNLLFC
jgi:hypothetical protein